MTRPAGDGEADDWQVRFERAFGVAPSIAATAPGRVNLIGEHVDYCEGFVLPLAIPRRAVVAAAPSPDGLTRVRSTAFPEAIDVDASALRFPRPTGTFADRLLGVLAAFKDVPPLSLLVHSAVPVGGGLSSSAAVGVATALVAESLGDGGARRPPPREDPARAAHLALRCQWAEHAVAGVPCGIMDMLASVAARAGHALLLDCREVRWEHVPLFHGWPEPPELLVIDTRTTHDHAGGAYASRRAECEQAAAELGVAALRDADEATIAASALAAPLRSRAEHVASELRRVQEFVEALRRRDPERLGELLLESHASLRDRFEVSCAELDHLVDGAAALRGAGGALGARLTGGGFGGCAIALVRAGAADAVAAELSESFERRFGHLPSVFTATPCDGAELLPAAPA